MKVKYTKDQLLAIESHGSNIIVSAGAGSGKTQVLTERVVHFIEKHHYRLNDFLILTFTNLAAGEMKERIRQKLIDRGLEDANLVDTSYISTFDSYAFSLVKQYHFELGISANISIVDSNIISVRKWTIIDDIFEELYGAQDEKFLELIDRFCFKDDQDIRNIIFKLYSIAVNELDTNNYLDNYFSTYFNDVLVEEVMDIFKDKIIKNKEELRLTIGTLPDVELGKKDSRTYREAAIELFKDFLESQTYEKLQTTYPPKLTFRRPSDILQMDKDIIKVFVDQTADLRSYLKSLPYDKTEFLEYFNDNKQYVETIINIVKELDTRVKAYKSKYQLYEFSDIAKLALELVKTNQKVRESLKMGFKMIMIDEYQDTSVLQEEFISLIENNNVYMVGDVKQSIYRFRNARCDIFINKYDQYKYHGKGIAIDLNKNFRSREEVLGDINYIFKSLMTKDLGGASYIDDHLIEYGNKSFINEGRLNVSSHLDFLIRPEKVENVVETEANMIARDIINKINSGYKVFDEGKLREVKFSDFCIIMDRGTTFDEYSRIFTKYKIPLFVHNDENIKDVQIVKLLRNILILVKSILNKDYHSKQFKKAFVTTARSFLYNYDDDTIYNICTNNKYYDSVIIKEIKTSLYNTSSLPMGKRIETLIFDLDVYSKCIQSGNVIKNEKYLDLFLNLFNEMSKIEYELDDFLLYLENIDTYNLKITLSSSGSSLDSVTIMNVHKSKGLEYKIIYFTGLHAKMNLKDTEKSFNVSSKFGVILPPEDSNKTHLLKIVEQDKETKDSISETIRLFYVALTRTKEKMICVLGHKSYEKLIEEINNEKINSFINNNDLDNKPLTEQFHTTVFAYLNKEINEYMLEEIFDRYCLYLPSTLIDANYETFYLPFKELLDEINNFNLGNISFDDFIKGLMEKDFDEDKIDLFLKHYNKCYKEDEKQTKDDIYSSYTRYYVEYKSKIENAVKDYKEGLINKENLINFFNLLDYDINTNYLDTISSVDKCDLGILITNVRTLKNPAFDERFITKLLKYQNNLDLLMRYYYQYFRCYPNEQLLREYIYRYEHNEISTIDLNHLINYCGYLPVEDMAGLSSTKDLKGVLIPTPNIIEHIKNLIETTKGFDKDVILRNIFKDYLDTKITEADFIHLINLLEYSLTANYKCLTDEEKAELTIDDIYQLIMDDYPIDYDFNEARSFKDFINPFVDRYLFNKYVINLEDAMPQLNLKQEKTKAEKLVIDPLNIQPVIIEKFRASKKLDLSSSKKNMQFGTQLHFYLETIDFLNPDYTNVDSIAKKVIQKFLNDPLLANIKNGTIYKEYEFFDEETNTSGIIDLMIVYDNYIDIIDYKTKNIEDDSYIKQLNIYATYIKRVFNKDVNTYLYSLLDNTTKKCN